MSFENAPVTKGIMVGCAITSILVGLFDVKHYFHLQFVPHLSRHHQYWRLPLHHLAFSNSSDLFAAELILYNVAIQIERQFGSIKFASFSFVSTILATIFEFLALLLFHRVGVNHIAMGPSALLFSILYQYSRIVPSAYNFRVFGISFTNKSFIYVLAIQVFLSRFPSSAVVAIIGLLTGQIYRSDLANLKSYRLPPWFIRFSTRFLLPLIGALRPPRRSSRALPEASRPSNVRGPSGEVDEVVTTARPVPNRARNASATDVPERPSLVTEWVEGLTGRTERTNAGIRVPSEPEITHVANMFPDIQRDIVIAALQRSAGIEGAVEILLGTHA